VHVYVTPLWQLSSKGLGGEDGEDNNLLLHSPEEITDTLRVFTLAGVT